MNKNYGQKKAKFWYLNSIFSKSISRKHCGFGGNESLGSLTYYFVVIGPVVLAISKIPDFLFFHSWHPICGHRWPHMGCFHFPISEMRHCRGLTPLLQERILSFRQSKIIILSKYAEEHRKKQTNFFFLFIIFPWFSCIPYVIIFFQKIPIFPMYLKFHASHMWAPNFFDKKKLEKNTKFLV